MSHLQTPSVIRSLENMRIRLKRRLTDMPEYRAFLAMEMPMAEVSHIPDLFVHLETAKQKILDRLNLRREYQALLTVDKAIKEISEVLEFLGEEENFDAMPGQAVAPEPLANAQIVIPSALGLRMYLQESLVAAAG